MILVKNSSEACLSFFVALIAVLAGCSGNTPDDEEGAKACARAFAEDFFNFKYKEARLFCTDSSALWLDFFVSNITRSDADSIRALTVRPTVEISHVKRGENDSTSIADCKVSHAFVLDTLGHPGHLVDEACYKIPMVRERGKWKIKMVDLLRSGK